MDARVRIKRHLEERTRNVYIYNVQEEENICVANIIDYILFKGWVATIFTQRLSFTIVIVILVNG